MTKKQWKARIKKSCEEAGTYRVFFESVIETLASILENRDRAVEVFEANGGELLIEHTNKAGATNLEQNPAIRLINDLNRDALAYWRDLGLTPNGLKKINEEALRIVKRSSLGEVLRSLEN